MKKRILSFLAVLLILVSVFPVSIFAAESSSDVEPITDLSKTTIEEDFKNVFNGSFNVDDYVVNKLDTNLKLIALTEYENALGDIELYLYVYNPSQRTFYERGTNKVTLSYENDTALFDKYNKYTITRIDSYNYTKNLYTETNGTILKYKVEDITVSTESNQRAYAVSELELQLKNGVLSFSIGKSFIFTKTIAGTYDVLTNEKDVIVIDELGHTYYRVQSSDTNIANDIRTVYFAVPKNIVNRYGTMSTIDCRWQELTTQPILLLDNEDIVKDFQSIAGADTLGDFKYSFGAGMCPGLLTNTAFSVGHFGTDFQIGFNTSKFPSRFYAGTNYYFNSIIENFVWSEHFHNTYFDLDDGFNGKVFDTELEKLYLAMYCSYENGARVPGEELEKVLDEYDGKEDNLYLSELFTSTSDTIQATFTVEDINNLGKYEISTSYLNYLLNFFKYDTDYQGEISYEKFDMFDTDDLALDNIQLSTKWLIDIYDVDSFRTFAKNNSDCYIYFLRYSVTETITVEASVFGGKELSTGSTILDKLMIPAECYVCNGSLVETVFVKDFDIITLGFDNQQGGYTVVPVGTTPTSSIVDLNQVVKRLPKEKANLSWFDTLISIVTTIGIIISVIIVIQVVFIVVLIINIFKKPKKRKVKKNEKKNN